MLAVILLRGLVKTRKEVKDTLKMLRLHRKNHCVIVHERNIGMLRKARNWITWGKISEETLRDLILKRGRYPGRKRVKESDVDKIMNEIKSKKPREWSIVPVFRLSPPSKGFKKSIKKYYPDGELGDRKEKINDLLKRMM